MKNIQIIETVTFHTKSGVTEDALRTAAEGLERYFESCPGYISRAMYKTADGAWMDQLTWADAASVAAADAAFSAQPEAGAYMALVDRETIKMHHAPALYIKAA